MTVVARVALYGYAAATLVPVALLLVFLVGSLALSGAQATPDGLTKYDAPVPFPLFVVPEWVLIGCAVVALALVVPLIVTTSVAYGGRLIGMLSYTGGAMIADAFFSFAFPVSDGLIASSGDPDTYLGGHIVGVALSVVCIIVLVIRLVVTNREYLRMRKAGELPDGQW